MKALLILAASAVLLAGCGGGANTVSANSADAVTTTAVGNVVATIPSPTPTPDEAANATSTPSEDDTGEMAANDSAP